MRAAPLRPLPRRFFDRPPERVAAALIGKLLVRLIGEDTLSARIVETEAYGGAEDPAAHSFRGRTERNAVLFGPPGHAYIYLSYGLHWCLNVSTLPAGRPGGVLFRALEPVAGAAVMAQRAPLAKSGGPRQLLSGPGRLARALAIDHDLNGLDLTRPGPLYIAADGFRPGAILVTRRVGISRAVEAPRRFYLEGSAAVTRPRQPVLARMRAQ